MLNPQAADHCSTTVWAASGSMAGQPGYFLSSGHSTNQSVGLVSQRMTSRFVNSSMDGAAHGGIGRQDGIVLSAHQAVTCALLIDLPASTMCAIEVKNFASLEARPSSALTHVFSSIVDNLALQSDKRKHCPDRVCQNVGMPSKHIGLRLKALMAARKVSTSGMAEHCGITRGAVSNWFVQGRITKDNLSKAAVKLRTTTDRLINYDVEEILELEEIDRQKAARGMSPDQLDKARSELARQQYSLGALEVAYIYDKLPDDLARNRAIAYLEALLNRNSTAESEAAKLAPSAPRAVPRTRSSATPRKTLRSDPKKSRA